MAKTPPPPPPDGSDPNSDGSGAPAAPESTNPAAVAAARQCLVRPPANVTCVVGRAKNGNAISVTFKAGTPKWVSEDEATECVRAGGLIEDRR